MHAQNGPTEGRERVGKGGGWGEKTKGGDNTVSKQKSFLPFLLWKIFNSCTTVSLYTPPPLVFSLLVQKGAVCQWWLSWVKQVRPGMLHVSLFWSLLRNLRSFFRRFCSFCSHWLFCFDAALIQRKHIQYGKAAEGGLKKKIFLHVKECQCLPEWLHMSCTEPEGLFILEEITARSKKKLLSDMSVIRSTRRWLSGRESLSPGSSVALAFLWPHLLQVAFDLTEVLDFGLQGFDLNGNKQPHRAQRTPEKT